MSEIQHARFIQALAVQVEVIAMQEANKERERQNNAPAYGEAAFFEASARMVELSMSIIHNQ